MSETCDRQHNRKTNGHPEIYLIESLLLLLSKCMNMSLTVCMCM